MIWIILAIWCGIGFLIVKSLQPFWPLIEVVMASPFWPVILIVNLRSKS
jgi:hypothetical protein